MAWTHTADQMIESIKTRIRVPTSQSTYTTAKILDLINEELERHVVPKILACRENYFLYEEDTSIVSGTKEYKIPYRAIGGKVKAVKWYDGTNEKRLKQMAYEDVYIYQQGDYNEPFFYIKRNSIVIVPTPTSSSDSIRWGYYLKPNSVVAVSDSAKITSIDTATNSVTASSVGNVSDGIDVDIIRGRGGFECLAIDKTVSVSGSTITFSETLPTDLAVGDYVCKATESPFPQIPADIHSYLTLRVCKVMLEGLGYFDEAALIKKDIKEAEKVFDTMLTPRSDGNPKKIINRFTTLRR